MSKQEIWSELCSTLDMANGGKGIEGQNIVNHSFTLVSKKITERLLNPKNVWSAERLARKTTR